MCAMSGNTTPEMLDQLSEARCLSCLTQHDLERPNEVTNTANYASDDTHFE